MEHYRPSSNGTQIANRVLGQLSADQTEAFFRKYPEFFRLVVIRYYSLDEELIEHFADCLDWKCLSVNKLLPWSMDFIDRYEERWDWESLSEGLPWSVDLIEL